MIRKPSRSDARAKRHYRLRNKISGTAEQPRLAVFRSNMHIYAQIIDDTVGNTLCAASTMETAFFFPRPSIELNDGISFPSTIWNLVACTLNKSIGVNSKPLTYIS